MAFRDEESMTVPGAEASGANEEAEVQERGQQSNAGNTSPRQRRVSRKKTTESVGSTGVVTRSRARARAPSADDAPSSKEPAEQHGVEPTQASVSFADDTSESAKNTEVASEIAKYSSSFVWVACVLFMLVTIPVCFMNPEDLSTDMLVSPFPADVIDAVGSVWNRVWS